jgi:hypothetical protein
MFTVRRHFSSPIPGCNLCLGRRQPGFLNPGSILGIGNLTSDLTSCALFLGAQGHSCMAELVRMASVWCPQVYQLRCCVLVYLREPVLAPREFMSDRMLRASGPTKHIRRCGTLRILPTTATNDVDLGIPCVPSRSGEVMGQILAGVGLVGLSQMNHYQKQLNLRAVLSLSAVCPLQARDRQLSQHHSSLHET